VGVQSEVVILQYHKYYITTELRVPSFETKIIVS